MNSYGNGNEGDWRKGKGGWNGWTNGQEGLREGWGQNERRGYSPT